MSRDRTVERSILSESAQKLEVETAVVRLLAAREHSRTELERKLVGRYAEDVLSEILDELAERGLQSDQRFAEAYARMRQNKGYGSLAIVFELKQRGVSADLIESALETLDQDWLERLRQLHERKYGADLPDDYKEAARRGRFFTQRGFPGDLIRRFLSGH